MRTENCGHGEGCICMFCDPFEVTVYSVGRPLNAITPYGTLPAPVNQGWRCPTCKKCYAPFVSECNSCNTPDMRGRAGL